MDDGPTGQAGGAIGREAEAAALQAFLEPGSAARAFVLSGRPGIGKTTLWEAGIGIACERGLRVLQTRASGAEARLAYAALIDLLDGVGAEQLSALPSPQRRALEVALLRTEPSAGPPAPNAVAVGFLNALRALARREPLLVAADDIQWLDPPSADALTFAARRLEDESVRFLLAKRPGATSPLERALERRLEPLEVRPLSLGATQRMLSVRLGLSLPRHVLRRVFESTLGNPLFALEVGRSLLDRGQPELGEDMPVPGTVEEVLGTRVTSLAPPVRTLLLAVALSADPRVSRLTEIVDPAVLEDGVDAGVLVVDGDRIRASHPLLAAVVKERSSTDERREVHLELAAIAQDEELRAHHLALASPRADEELASTVAAAATAAAARGAAQDAAALAEHALRLTPPDSPRRIDRLFALAEHLDVAGEPERVTALLTPELASLPPGPVQGRAHVLLGTGAVSVSEAWQHLEHALASSNGDRALRALVLAKMAIVCAATRVERIGDSEAWALEALEDAQAAGADTERLALHGLAWARILGGRPIDDLAERFRTASNAAFHIADSLDRVVGARLAWRGQVADARALLASMIELADERDEPWSSAVLRMNLCDLTMRCGEWLTAARLLDEWSESFDRDLLARGPFYERCRAMLAAGLGNPEAAEQWAAPAIDDAEASGERWSQLVALRVRGLAALLARDPARAVESLSRVWEHTQREGVQDPGAHPVVADLVEALVALGELEEAQSVTDRLRQQAKQQEHPWALLTTTRCDALIRLTAAAYDEGAAADLAGAAAGYDALGLRFDSARALLSLGRVQRRLRKWGAARASLEQAASAFAALGSTGWADVTRSELERVGARRPRAVGELTNAERRVVDLAVDGLSNKEIARALVVTVPTVETHLSRAYGKLGVRSRTQLARRLSSGA
jgi:DNA-binding CsgD family transcriptional regulator/tetratricopeptide (TPR) repeat protein